MDLFAKFMAYTLLTLGVTGLVCMGAAYFKLADPGIGAVGLVCFVVSAFFSWFFFGDHSCPHL